MKTITILFAALLLAGCSTITERNAKNAADIRAGRAAAEEAKRIAAEVREAVKGITPHR